MGFSGCGGKLTPLLNREAVLLKTFLLPKFWKCPRLFWTFWLTRVRVVGENMFTEAWKQVPPCLPALRSSALCFRVKAFWIESSLTSGAELSSPRTNLLYPVPGGWGGGGQLCCWGMHVKRHWRPVNSRLLIRCNIMDHLGHKEPGRKKLMHVLRFTAFPEVCGTDPSQETMLVFLQQNVFLIQTVHPEGMRDYQRKAVICWWLITGDGSEIHLILAPADQILFFFSSHCRHQRCKKATFMIGKLAEALQKYSHIWRWGQWRHLVLLAGLAS